MKVRVRHPGAYLPHPDGKGGGTAEIEYDKPDKHGAVTGIDVVMALKGATADPSKVLFAEVKAPSDDAAAAQEGRSDEVWFAGYGGERYAAGVIALTTANAWAGPAAGSTAYIPHSPDGAGTPDLVMVDTTSPGRYGVGVDGAQLDAPGTAGQIAGTFAPDVAAKVADILLGPAA